MILKKNACVGLKLLKLNNKGCELARQRTKENCGY